MLHQAHRGVCTECPENTMPAFLRAVEQGYPVIELDPKFTADDICVVLHDWDINRTCRTAAGAQIEAQTPVSSLTFAQTQELDAGIWFAPEFQGTKIPTLMEVLILAKAHRLHVKIDNVFAHFPQFRQQILFDIVEASGADVGFTCANDATVETVVARFPKATIHYDGFVDEDTVLRIRSLLRENPLTVWLPFDNAMTAWCTMPKATPQRCAMVKKYARLGVWILSEESERMAAEALGADLLETTGSLKP